MTAPQESRVVLMVHPSAELYGSDRMFAESVAALADAGRSVVVALPGDGPLVPLLRSRGARVVFCSTPVLRKAALRPLGFLRLAFEALRALVTMVRLLRASRPDALYVNTVTVPLWPVLGRLLGVPVLVHVHEAEDEVPAPVRAALAAPLLAAHRVVANSAATARTLATAISRLSPRTNVIYNGVAGPPEGVAPNVAFGALDAPKATLGAPHDPLRLVLVGRLSPRKGTDVAVAAVEGLHAAGVRVRLELVGSAFEGYEWYVEQVREQIRTAGLEEHVRFAGFTPDVWTAYGRADVALVPSRVEPFGNASVEAQLAGIPVVVSNAQGLPETVDGGTYGLIVPRDDPKALADAIQSLVDDWPAATARAEKAREAGAAKFDPKAYRAAIAAELDNLSKPRAR